jgi:hypothetical protein
VTGITTALGLLAAVRPHMPVVEDGDLVFGSDLPADLEPVVEVLQTGIRACLTGRPWWGSSVAPSHPRPRVERLNPGEPLPTWVGLLAVEGDQTWDRIRPAAKLDFRGLFAGDVGQGVDPIRPDSARLDALALFVGRTVGFES